MTLWEEIKRRRVVTTGVAYLAAAWLAVEVVSQLVGIFELPSWIPRFAVVLLALGFPLVLALSWIFDVTADGVRRTDPHSPRGRFVVLTALAMLLFGTVAAYLLVAPGDLDRNVIAVMPCEDWTDDTDDAHLPEGIAEDIIARLSSLKRIRAIARSTTWSLRYQNLDAKQIGERVGARFVLTCSVRSIDDTLLINAELIDAKTNQTIDTMNFQRGRERIIDVLNEVSVAIARGMSREVLGDELPRLAEHGTNNADALDMYMRGRFHFNQMTANSHLKAIDYYDHALQLDPNYAMAHIAIADSQIYLTQFLAEPASARRDRIMLEVNAALEIDDSLASAWAVLGHARMSYDNDWRGAAAALERAHEIDPWNLEVNNYLRQYYAIVGPAARMLPYAEAALKIDPLGQFTNAQLIFTYETMRQYENAIEASDRAIDLDPNFWLFYWPRAWALTWLGEHEEALRTIEHAMTLWGDSDNLELIATRGMILATMGRHADARIVLDELKAIDNQRHISPMYLVMVLASLGETEESLTMLERAHEENDWLVKWVIRTPMIDPLRDSPRFQAIMLELQLSEDDYLADS